MLQRNHFLRRTSLRLLEHLRKGAKKVKRTIFFVVGQIANSKTMSVVRFINLQRNGNKSEDLQKGQRGRLCGNICFKEKTVSHLYNNYVVGKLLHKTTFLLSCFAKYCTRWSKVVHFANCWYYCQKKRKHCLWNVKHTDSLPAASPRRRPGK